MNVNVGIVEISVLKSINKHIGTGKGAEIRKIEDKLNSIKKRDARLENDMALLEQMLRDLTL